jgi:hypothetical protein
VLLEQLVRLVQLVQLGVQAHKVSLVLVVVHRETQGHRELLVLVEVHRVIPVQLVLLEQPELLDLPV